MYHHQQYLLLQISLQLTVTDDYWKLEVQIISERESACRIWVFWLTHEYSTHTTSVFHKRKNAISIQKLIRGTSNWLANQNSILYAREKQVFRKQGSGWYLLLLVTKTVMNFIFRYLLQQMWLHYYVCVLKSRWYRTWCHEILWSIFLRYQRLLLFSEIS